MRPMITFRCGATGLALPACLLGANLVYEHRHFRRPVRTTDLNDPRAADAVVVTAQDSHRIFELMFELAIGK